MDINKVFPSKYIKSDDIKKGKKVKLTIDNCVVEDIGGDEKPVLYFKESPKGMVLNKTNAGILAMVYGPETSKWDGKVLFLYSAPTSFQGRMVQGLKVEVPHVEEEATEIFGGTEPNPDDETPF